MQSKQSSANILKASEREEQQTLISWCEFSSAKYEDLDTIFHIPNEGKRSIRGGAILKSLGMRSGVPDLFLPVARGGYHGLFIEMKTRNGRTTENQVQWLRRLSRRGYKSVVCYGADEAIAQIEAYYAHPQSTCEVGEPVVIHSESDSVWRDLEKDVAILETTSKMVRYYSRKLSEDLADIINHIKVALSVVNNMALNDANPNANNTSNPKDTIANGE